MLTCVCVCVCVCVCNRSVGGLRISLYNAVSVAETQVLVNFMKDFMARHRQ